MRDFRIKTTADDRRGSGQLNIRFGAIFLCLLLLSTAATAADVDSPKIAPADLSSEPVYYGAAIEPPKGRVYHGWGQFSSLWNQGAPAGTGDEKDLEAYQQAVKPFRPVMLSFYTEPDPKALPIFVQRYKKVAAERGCFVAQIGLSLNSVLQEVANGERDPELVLLADSLHESHNPALLRIGNEISGSWNPSDSSKYIKSFRSIVGRLREAHASNVAAVWAAMPSSFEGVDYMRWYPGDDVVDWWSVSIVGFQDFDQPKLAAFLDFARAHHKPVLIGFASPVLSSKVPAQMRGPSGNAQASEWYRKFAELLRRRPEIQAVTIVSVDLRRMKQMVPNADLPDARITNWPKAVAVWKATLSDHRFIEADECSSIRAR